MRREDRERILTEVGSWVVQSAVDRAAQGGPSLEEILADGVFHELRRLREEKDSKLKREDLTFWNKIRGRLGRGSERELQGLLARVVDRYANEVGGNFDERIYRMSTSILPPALGLLLNAVSPSRLLRGLNEAPRLDDHVLVQGEVNHLRALHEVGTVLLCPTHVSNLDSLVMGFAIYQMGLPPFVYGAGLNLFTNRVMGYFMNNLGAYTVDRKKRDPTYKEVLKKYAGLTMEYGYDNLFFPGGTRSRSGAIERHLKLGLLGTSVSAYVHNLKRNKPGPKIFIVPCTLSFQLVLEAETLMDDFLKDVGKARYIISDDEFSRPKRIWDFMSRLFNLDSRIYLTISRGYDPFGNPVDDAGHSFDPRGREVDISKYVLLNGEPQVLPQRDAEYTTEVGHRIADAYARDNVVQSTHVTARAVFSLLRDANPGVGLVRLIRMGGRTDDLDLRQVHERTRQLLSELRGLAERGGIRLTPLIQSGRADDVVSDGLRHFAIYHETAAATRRGDRVFATDRMLLFYYQNRLEGYRMDRSQGGDDALSPDHQTLGVAA